MNINLKKGSKQLILWGILIAAIYFLTTEPQNTAFLFIALFIYVVWIGNAVEKLEKPGSRKISLSRFSVNPQAAIFWNKRFGELIGLKSEGDDRKNGKWPKSDQDKWFKKGGLKEKYWDKITGINLVYLPSEDAYVVRDNNNYSSIISRHIAKTLLYSTTIAGEGDQLSFSLDRKHLDLEIYERIPNLRKSLSNKEQWELPVISVCLKYYAETYPSKEDEFIVLCELPLFFLSSENEIWKKAPNYIEKLGFEERTDNWPDGPMKDDFGEEEWGKSMTSYKKNGVEITFF